MFHRIERNEVTSWYFVNEDCLVFKAFMPGYMMLLDYRSKHGKADRRVGYFSETFKLQQYM